METQALNEIKWNAQGLIPAIAQDWQSGQVLMLAWMNRESLQLTIKERRAVYWSRSRAEIWRKGETSGHVQHLHSIHLDCDGDALLLKVDQVGGIACHTGRPSCFFRSLEDGGWQLPATPEPTPGTASSQPQDVLLSLASVLEARKQADASTSYVASLYQSGMDRILKKVGEEAAETLIAAKSADLGGSRTDVFHETADLWFHTLVMLSHLGAGPGDVTRELAKRFGLSGLEEKAARGGNKSSGTQR